MKFYGTKMFYLKKFINSFIIIADINLIAVKFLYSWYLMPITLSHTYCLYEIMRKNILQVFKAVSYTSILVYLFSSRSTQTADQLMDNADTAQQKMSCGKWVCVLTMGLCTFKWSCTMLWVKLICSLINSSNCSMLCNDITEVYFVWCWTKNEELSDFKLQEICMNKTRNNIFHVH